MVNSLIGGHTSNYGIMLNIQTWGISLCETLSVTNNIVSLFSLRVVECLRRKLEGSKADFFFFSMKLLIFFESVEQTTIRYPFFSHQYTNVDLYKC